MFQKITSLSVAMAVCSSLSYAGPFEHYVKENAARSGKSETEVRNESIEVLRKEGKYNAADLERVGLEKGDLDPAKQNEMVNLLLWKLVKKDEPSSFQTGLEATKNEAIAKSGAAAFNAMKTESPKSIDALVAETLNEVPNIQLIKDAVMVPGMYVTSETGGMSYSFSGNSYGPIYHTREFPFSLASNLGKRSKLAPAILVKVAFNLRDYVDGRVEVTTHHLGKVTLNNLSGVYQVDEFERAPTGKSFLKSEINAYRAMYRFIKKAYSASDLEEISSGWLTRSIDKEIAKSALLLSEKDFILQFTAQSAAAAGYSNASRADIAVYLQ